MTPLPPAGERSLQAVGARRSVPGQPTGDELVARLRERARGATALVALLDADAIVGERHLLSAWAHLGRSRQRGEPRLRDRGAEFALYAAGDDQLGRAIAKIGISDRTSSFVLIAERPLDADQLLAEFGLVRDPGAYPRAPTEAALERLGIDPATMRSVPPSAWEGLVLERIALVDLSSPSGAAGGSKHGAGAKH